MKPDAIIQKNLAKIRFMFRSFQSRNYRLYFGGQVISLVGSWIQTIAISWLVYRLTNSAYLLGLVSFINQLPNFVITPFAGVFVDRWDRRNTLIVTRTLSMLQAFALAFLVLSGRVNFWHIAFLGLFLGIIGSFNVTARQAFLFDIIEKKEDFGSAVSLNASMLNIGRMLGPFIAGVMINAMGEGICFVLNGISYIVGIAVLFAIRVAPSNKKPKESRILQELKEGFAYTLNSTPIISIILLQGLFCMMGWPITVLMPIYAKEIFHGGADTLGFLTGASGLGAMVSIFYIAASKDVRRMSKLILVAAGVFSIALIAFAQSYNLWFSLFLLTITGFGLYAIMVAGYTILQTIVDDDKRGRVISIFNMAYMGMLPFGSLLAGNIADRVGAPNTLLIAGISCLAGAAVFAAKYRAICDGVGQQMQKVVSISK